MEEDKAGSGLGEKRTRRSGLLLGSLLSLAWAQTALAEPRHFELPSGDARVMLNEFSRQADLQVLFDFALLKGLQTRPVVGDFEPSDALRSLLQDVPVKWSWVNDHTLAITPIKKPVVVQNGSRLRRWWQKLTTRPPVVQSPDNLEQILIAAHNDINQAPPIGASLLRLTRADIQNSGLATTQDFIHTLPQVFGGGPSEDTTLGREAQSNSTKGSGFNLRGLDASATLVLIDGQRMAPSGGLGLFSDISNIPLNAIDHVDILPDGASAQFGADAIGGVANFVLRSDFTGVETQLRNGFISGGSLGERQASSLWGTKWDSGRGMLGFEYYDRDALPASDRLQATSDLRQFGGSNFDVQYGAGPGNILLGPQTFALPALTGATRLTAGDLVPGTQNLYDQWGSGVDFLPERKRWSLFGTLRNEMADGGISLFTDALLTRRTVGAQIQDAPLMLSVPASNPYYVNITGDSSPLAVVTGSNDLLGRHEFQSTVDTGNISAGVTFFPSRSWSITGRAAYAFEKDLEFEYGLADSVAVDAALADSNPTTALDPFAGSAGNNPATLAGLGRTSGYRSNSNLKTLSFTATGAVLTLPGGAAKLAVGGEYRDQTLDTTTFDIVQGMSQNPAYATQHRNVRSTFASLQLPLLGSGNGLPFARRLELSLGARYEDYSDVGGAGIPKVGLLWAPLTSLSLRGTWTRAFRPPSLADLAPGGGYTQLIRVPDPTAPGGITTALFAYGTNPTLEEERARTWTLGAEIAPPSLLGASLAFTYFNTYYDGRIDLNQIQPTVLESPQFAWLVTRDVTGAARASLCDQTTFLSSASGSCLDTPVGAIVDNRLRNIEHLQTQGIDVLAKYPFSNSLGNFSAGLNATYLLEYSEARTPGLPTESLLSTANNPINLRFRASLSWEHRGFGASGFLNFDNGYRDDVSVPNRSIRSWTTVDLQIRYVDDRNDSGPLSGVEFAISAQNVFNVSPPFLNNALGFGYDSENADLIGRVVSLDLRKRW